MTPEIRAFEYAMGLFSVVIGLAVADVATSFHRLVRSRAPVIWDPLALLAAVYTLCLAVAMWFDIWGVRNFAATRHFAFYLTLIFLLLVLFLAAAASLPDEVGEPIDLHTYYRENRRWFWSLVTVFQLAYVAFGFYFAAGELKRLPPLLSAAFLTQMCAPFVISAVLLVMQSRAVHYVGLLMLFVIMALHYAQAQIN